MINNNSENKDFLSKQIITYIGNKRKLLPFIETAITGVASRLGRSKLETVDLFSGSGVVSRLLKKHSTSVYSNDIELYSEITNSCYLTNKSVINYQYIRDAVYELNTHVENNLSDGFISRMYSPMSDENIQKHERAFFTRSNAMYIDTAREYISKLPDDISNYMLAPLIYAASVHNNTSGVFKGFYKGRDGVGKFGGEGENALKRIMGKIKVVEPIFSDFECDVSVTRYDSNQFFAKSGVEEVDLLYLDPPYNQHPYGANYFMLNLICENVEPKNVSKVSGIPKDWQRSSYNSKATASQELFDLVLTAPAKFILISYNSEGFIPHDLFVSTLSSIGKLSVMETQYNSFRGSRNLSGRSLYVTEFLYLLEK